ncbi:alpha-2-macroglobulin [Plakobranchus ocellatus]|uniref:Alpha-2-macroglobulin n=1 Tax=Plakobranchus ocellatus TaxID=259542 RepID=A0AAV4C7R4_9GAST|nr:alpha-2-macroglobulin [Plakobranchus ocellatus]
MEVILRTAEGSVGHTNLGGGCSMSLLKAFMDDTTVICSKEDETRRMLTRLDVLMSWCRMEFKLKKSRSLLIREAKVEEATIFTVAEQQILTVSQEPVKSRGRWYDSSMKDTRYFHGNYVHGDLSLDFCWVSQETQESTHPCYQEEAWLDGCYNFSVNANSLGNVESFTMLEIQAKVTDSKNRVTVVKTHRGPEKSKWSLNIRLEDYTDGYFKPGLPYRGKVIVTRLDRTPAAGEIILVTAEGRESSSYFSRNFTTDASGEIAFALCGNLTNFTSIKIGAQSLRFELPVSPHEDWLWKQKGFYTSSRSHVRYLRQWFSLSLSYVQLPQIDSPLQCHQRSNLPVVYTTRAGSKVLFQYQVKCNLQS